MWLEYEFETRSKSSQYDFQSGEYIENFERSLVIILCVSDPETSNGYWTSKIRIPLKELKEELKNV